MSLSKLRWTLDERLYNAPDPMSVARDVLNNIGNRVQLLELLRSILSDESLANQIASCSCEHPNGFDKINLINSDNQAYKLRMHIWWHDHIVRRPEDVHNHSWDFSSIILMGSLRSQEYQISETGVDKYQYVYNVKPFDPVVEYVGKSKLRCIFDDILMPGNCYTLSHRVLHRVTRNSSHTTVTLVVQGRFLSDKSSIYADQPLQIQNSGKLPMRWFSITDLQERLKKLSELCESDIVSSHII